MAAQLKTELTLKDNNFNAKLNSACRKAQNALSQVSSSGGLLGKSIGGAASSINGLIGSFSRLAGPMAAATASIAAVGAAMKTCVDNGAKFELALDHLQSLTGLTAQQMGQVKEQILQTAGAYNIAASELANAYGVIGSKMPELLKSPDALDKVARAASTLAKAGVMPLEESIESLTGIMNQMSADSAEADNYINVLAAGSKNGAGNIQYLAEAFNKAGGAISNAGLSVEQGTAVIEALAKRMPDAAVAGTQLKNVLLTLATTSNKDLNPSIVGLDTALHNLQNISGDASKMVELFGKGNYNAAMILAQEADTVAELTNQVSGTSEAHDQAAINTNNLSSKVGALQTAWENLTSAIGASNGVLSACVDWLTQAINGFLQLISVRNAYEGIDTGISQSNQDQQKYYEDKYKGNKKEASKADKRKAAESVRKENTDYLEQENKKLDKLYADRAKIVDKAYKNNPNAKIENFPAIQNIDKQIELSKKRRDDLEKEDVRLQKVIENFGKKNNNKTTTTKGGSKKGGSTVKNTKKEAEAAAGSLKALEKELSDLQTAYQKGLKPDMSLEEYFEKVADLQKRIKDERIRLRLEPDPNSIPGIEAEIRRLDENQINPKLALKPEEYRKARKEAQDRLQNEKIKWGIEFELTNLDKLKKQRDEFVQKHLTGQSGLSGEEYKKQLKEMDKQIASEEVTVGVSLSKDDLDQEFKETLDDFRKKSSFEMAVGIEPPKSNEDKLSFIQQQMDENDALIEQLKKLQEEYAKLGEAGAEGYQQVSAKIEEVNAEQAQLSESAQAQNKVIKQTNKMSTGFSRAGEAIGAFGNIMSSLSFESPELNVAGIIAQSIAQIALGAGTAIAQFAETGNPFVWVAMSLATMAQLAAMVSQLHSITGYASGGIIGGGKSVGDKNIVAVNSGELILNKPQQARLWRMLNGSESSSISSQSGGQVEFKIRGADLYGSLKNYKTLSKKQ